jgi:L-threonylcarbamoyladenylate synthase
MQTEIITINKSESNRADESYTYKIEKAAEVIRRGGLVAFPTETVYGLGADIFNPDAVTNIFKAKNRPYNDPLIIHITDMEDLYRLTTHVPDLAVRLTGQFWPGPLTLLLNKSALVPDVITGGLATVAVRMPVHPIAYSLIQAAQTPVAAPSANTFCKPSSTLFEHVYDDLNGKIDLIIKTDIRQIGIESTIIDLTKDEPLILRPGAVTAEDLALVINDVRLSGNLTLKNAPGMFEKHYAPDTKLVLATGSEEEQIRKIQAKVAEYRLTKVPYAILCKDETCSNYAGADVLSMGSKENLAECAMNLFKALRQLDKQNLQVILAESFVEKGLGVAIMNRLRKAATVIC